MDWRDETKDENSRWVRDVIAPQVSLEKIPIGNDTLRQIIFLFLVFPLFGPQNRRFEDTCSPPAVSAQGFSGFSMGSYFACRRGTESNRIAQS
jgi:hypothetical protein